MTLCGHSTNLLTVVECFTNPFKDHFVVLWKKSMLTKFIQKKWECAPLLDVLCDFITKTWNVIAIETVSESFKMCCLLKSMGDTENSLLWQAEGNPKLKPHQQIQCLIHPVIHICMYKGWLIKSSLCMATFNDLSSFSPRYIWVCT
jgi:hypothetical protein